MAGDTPAHCNHALIQALCLEAGRIMEDVSADMALILPDQECLIRARVGQLYDAAEAVLALTNAARALVR